MANNLKKFIMTLLTSAKETAFDPKVVKEAGKSEMNIDTFMKLLMTSSKPSVAGGEIAKQIAFQKPLLNSDEVRFLKENFTPKQALNISGPRAVRRQMAVKFEQYRSRYMKLLKTGRKRIEDNSGGGFTFAGSLQDMSLTDFDRLEVKEKINILKQYREEINKLSNKEKFKQTHEQHVVGKVVQGFDGNSLRKRFGYVEGDEETTEANYQEYQRLLNKYLGYNKSRKLKSYHLDERDLEGNYRHKFRPKPQLKGRQKTQKFLKIKHNKGGQGVGGVKLSGFQPLRGNIYSHRVVKKVKKGVKKNGKKNKKR